MKSILLTTTALVAFAGAAAADGHAGVSFSGSAALGFNDNSSTGNDGWYGDMNLDVTMTAALDNGITVTATADVDELDVDDTTEDGEWTGITLAIASESASLTFGDTSPSADLHWDGVDGDSTFGFNGNTAHDDAGFDAIIRGEATMSGVTASVSYGVNMQDGATDSIDAMQVAAVAELGGFTVIGAYQGDIADSGVTLMGVSVAGAVAGVDVMGSFLTEDSTSGASSLGVSASMPFGPVTVGGYYSMNSSDVDAADALDAYGLDVSYSDGPISVSADYDMVEDAAEGTWEIDGSYDTGMGVMVYAGMNSGEDYYVAGTYDLGGGAELLVSYAVDEDNSSSDEVGAGDYQIGTTVEVSFSF